MKLFYHILHPLYIKKVCHRKKGVKCRKKGVKCRKKGVKCRKKGVVKWSMSFIYKGLRGGKIYIKREIKEIKRDLTASNSQKKCYFFFNW
jgi:hypothetical protein